MTGTGEADDSDLCMYKNGSSNSLKGTPYYYAPHRLYMENRGHAKGCNSETSMVTLIFFGLILFVKRFSTTY